MSTELALGDVVPKSVTVIQMRHGFMPGKE